MPSPPTAVSPPRGTGRQRFAGLLLLFLLALLPRLYSAMTVGWHWDYPGSFTLVNFDEGGSCRAALGGFDYSTFVGRQTIALASALDFAPPEAVIGNPRAVKAYCQGAPHMLVARAYSAVTGALTPVALAIIGLLLVPATPGVGWSAGVLLALSGFHLAESHKGTVDAPSTFFIYAFLALMAYAVSRRRSGALLASPLLLLAAVWTKYWVFALFAYLAKLPEVAWRYLTAGLGSRRIVLLVLATAALFGLSSNSDFQRPWLYPLVAAWYLLIPWRRVHPPMAVVWLLAPPLAYLLCTLEPIAAYTTGGATYGVIGWHKWPRNLLNLPLVLLVGLGLPACLFIPAGIRALARQRDSLRGWLCLLPLLAFALYMLFVAPVSYYRHYLPLLPAAALLACLGLYASGWARRRWFMPLFCLWPALLAVDLVADYHRDPRLELRQWYAHHPGAPVLFSYYVSPPVAELDRSALFRPEYAQGEAAALKQADYLVLSENWYDTAFANELNGPLVQDAGRLIKTRPAYVRFYREALAGRHPLLEREHVIEVGNYMPELLLHKHFYGTFQLFVGDLVIFRVRK